MRVGSVEGEVEVEVEVVGWEDGSRGVEVAVEVVESLSSARKDWSSASACSSRVRERGFGGGGGDG